MEILLSLTCPQSRMSIRIYIFNLKKRRKTNTHTHLHTHTQTNKHTHTHTHTHTNSRRKRISVENLKGYNKVICEFALRTLLDVCEFALFLLYLNFMYFMCNEGDHNICYTTTTYEGHIFKNKNKKKSLRDIFLYHVFLLYLSILTANLF